jgi:hypothetical protein
MKFEVEPFQEVILLNEVEEDEVAGDSEFVLFLIDEIPQHAGGELIHMYPHIHEVSRQRSQHCPMLCLLLKL